VIRPVAVFYAHATPKPARTGVHNFLSNLGEPVTFANRVLQFRPEPAGRTAGRFFLNSTLGVGGLFDVAERAGLKADDTNFGQTLARYGVAQGPYLFLPILGPSTVRDATGRVVDIFLDPLTWIRFRDDGYFYGARAVMNGVDARVIADPVLKDVQKNSADPYATLRAAYLQNSDFLSKGGKLDVQSLPDFGPEPAPAPPKP
jgi:phospholipid-binding lipoprotein MlaA